MAWPIRLTAVCSPPRPRTVPLPFRETPEAPQAETSKAESQATHQRPIIADRASEPGRRKLFRGHVGAVTGVAISPDAGTLATCGMDGTVRFWSPTRGAIDKTQPDLVLSDSPRAVALTYSPDGRLLAAAGADRISLWNARDVVETATLRSQSSPFTKIAFAPNAPLLASASKDWPISIWDLAAQRVKSALNGHNASVNAIVYSADGKVLVSAGDDGTVRVWDTAAGREVAALSANSSPVLSVAVSPSGKLAASGGADRIVRIWDIATRKEVAALTGHTRSIVALAFSPDGQNLVSAEGVGPEASASILGTQHPIRVWRLPKGEAVESFGPAGAAVHDMAFSPDGKTLATSDHDGVSLWDGETFEFRESLHAADGRAISPLCFSPDGTTLAAGSETAIVFWTATPFAWSSPPESPAH